MINATQLCVYQPLGAGAVEVDAVRQVTCWCKLIEEGFQKVCLFAQIVASTCRAMVGQVAGGGRTEKPLLKAGNAYHKYKVKRNSWPKVSSNLTTTIHCPHIHQSEVHLKGLHEQASDRHGADTSVPADRRCANLSLYHARPGK